MKALAAFMMSEREKDHVGLGLHAGIADTNVQEGK
jgi:hypothetical protein